MIADDGGWQMADDRNINYNFSGGLANICLPDELLSAFLRAYLIFFLCLHHPDNKQLYNPDNSYVKYQLKSLKAQKYAL